MTFLFWCAGIILAALLVILIIAFVCFMRCFPFVVFCIPYIIQESYRFFNKNEHFTSKCCIFCQKEVYCYSM